MYGEDISSKKFTLNMKGRIFNDKKNIKRNNLTKMSYKLYEWSQIQ